MPTMELVAAWERESVRIEQWPEQEKCQTDTASGELSAEIERAKEILALPEDWDGEGSASYSPATFARAAEFLKTHSEFLHDFGLVMPVPAIAAGPNGSIDIHWKRASWELLVNIPADVSKMASFYGDDYGVQQIKGTVNPETCNSGLAAWLMK